MTGGIEVWDQHGRLQDLLALDLERVTIEDIAHTLSQINRWGGRSPWPYTVARHSVDVLDVALQDLYSNKRGRAPWPWGALDLLREALLHDIPEALVGDVPSPLKRQLPAFRAVEAQVRRQLAIKFGLAVEEPPEIVVWDRRAREIEREILFKRPPMARYRTTPEQDRDRFLARYYEFT